MQTVTILIATANIYFKAYPKAKKFRLKCIKNIDLLEELFRGKTAIGYSTINRTKGNIRINLSALDKEEELKILIPL